MHTNRLLLTSLLGALLASFLAPALAEADLAPPAALEAGTSHPAEGLRILHRGQPVRNAPYSAQVVSERLQQLPDGNQIERRTSAASYRDSAGRTRQEVRAANGDVRTVTINDPVANAVWILTPRTRTALRLPGRADLARHAEGAAAAAARARIETLRKEGRLPALERGAAQGEAGAVRIERRVEERDGRRETVRVIRLPHGPGMDAAGFGPQLGPLIGPMIANAAADMKWATKAATRELGTREFDGVRAEGKQRSYEIPAGEVGNRNPIVVASETWYAPELQVTVYAKHSDPRSGDTIYRLEGLKRGEPDAALFTVPADYTVREAGRRVLRTPGKKED